MSSRNTNRVGPGNPAFVFYADQASIVGRHIVNWSPFIGSYGQGGAGFVGFELDDGNWLVSTLWGAGRWISIDGRMICSGPDKEDAFPAMHGMDEDGTTFDLVRDEILKTRPAIAAAEFLARSTHIALAATDGSSRKFAMTIDADPSKRPIFPGTGEPRALEPSDDLRQAWIVSNSLYINI